MLYKIFAFILLCSFYLECDSQIQSKEADCEICTCDSVKSHFSIEFKVTCKGDELTKIVLSERIFQTEPKPNLTRKVLVKIINFKEAEIEKSFLAIWSSYTSCLLDIKEVKKATFPDEAPERAESGAAKFIFGGIVITNSTVNRIPKNLFKKKESVGLKLRSSQLGSLNLYEVSQENLNFLDVENSIIDSIKGIPGMSLKFTTSLLRNKLQSFIKIKESKIGYIGENSFNFNQIGQYKPPVLIWKTSIGLIDTSAITLRKGTVFDLRESSIGNVLPGGIKFSDDDRKESIEIINNFMVVDADFVKSMKCDTVTEVRDNIFYISNMTNAHSLQDIYSDLSCKDNYIVNKQLILKTQESIFTTHLPPIPTTDLTEEIRTKTTLRVPSTSSTTTTTTPKTTIRMPTTTTTVLTTTTTTPTTSRTSLDTTTTTTTMPTTPQPPECPSTEASSISSHSPIPETTTTTEKALIQELPDARSLSPQIPTTLFIVIACLCIFLALAVLALSSYMVCKKSHRKKKSYHSDNHTSCLYEEPTAYFAPNPPKPLKLGNFETLDNNTKEDDRYQVKFGTGGKKGIICQEEESTYMNMR